MSSQKMKAKAKKGTMKRLIKTVFSFYPVLLPVTLGCIAFSAIISTLPSIFMQNVIQLITDALDGGLAYDAIASDVSFFIIILLSLYAVSLTAGFLWNQLMAVITQGVLKKLRDKMFKKMERLPVKYFDTHNHGDIMSHYTNDIDTLRQLVSQSLPQLIMSGIVVVSLVFVMLYFSLWMTLVVLVGVVIMLFVTGKIGGGSARHFVKQQFAIGRAEGYIEEMINGQKVIKVFCHEKECIEGFDRVNDELFREAERANKYANTLGPVLNNIGNILYVIVAIAGGILCLTVPEGNVSFSGLALTVAVAVPFLNMTKQFTGNVNQVSHQINAVVMGLAGASRIFELLDEPEEEDAGYVTLVNVTTREQVREHPGTRS